MASKGSGVRDYLIRVSNGMALGLFSSLIIGLILRQTGQLLGIPSVELFGRVAQVLMGPAIGAGVAFAVGAPPLGIFSSLAAGAIGAGSVTFAGGAASLAIGEPVGAFVAAWVGSEFSRMIAGKTGVDIIAVPAGTIVLGGFVGILAGPPIAGMMTWLGEGLNLATTLHPFPMGIILSVVMGLVLTLPISSAALSIALGLSGLAAGAAVVGCCCQMVGFAVSSYRENGVGGLIAQGIGTSMIQIPNIIRNPWIWVPPTAASAILGPLSTMVFRMENSRVGAGMGTSGLVGQVSALEVMGSAAWPGIIVLHILLPAALSLLFSELLRKSGHIKSGDMKL
ncbi:MAG TPA: PTS sugar transporter subunit IIC [Synergistaceae bacterium]|nr:PTS sugar transporter subunit IIC [Synergistaceae bacterium]